MVTMLRIAIRRTESPTPSAGTREEMVTTQSVVTGRRGGFSFQRSAAETSYGARMYSVTDCAGRSRMPSDGQDWTPRLSAL